MSACVLPSVIYVFFLKNKSGSLYSRTVLPCVFPRYLLQTHSTNNGTLLEAAMQINNRDARSLKMNETNPEQRVNFDRKRMGQFLTLAMTVVSLIIAMTSSSSSSQPANAQLSASQQQALNSLIKTGFTNCHF
jgi:hypothetical protein